MIGRAVEAWELPLLRKAEVDGKREPKKVLELFTKYCKEFKDGEEELANAPVQKVPLTPAEKRAITKTKNKAKKEADAEVVRLKAKHEQEEADQYDSCMAFSSDN